MDRARSRDSGGTGLGLAIVKHLVEIHGGTVEVESTIGVGTTFCIHLPISQISERSNLLDRFSRYMKLLKAGTYNIDIHRRGGDFYMGTKRILMTLGMAIAGVLLVVIAFTTWYTVDESEQAIVITFGKADAPVTDSGLHFKLPWPIQRTEILSKETFSLQFGFKQDKGGELVSYDKETKMITGDEYIVLADLIVQWKIIEPQKYLFNSNNPEEILHDATSASIRSIIGSSTIDAALTDGKAEIEAQTRELLATLIDKYDIGIGIQGVKLQDVELPNAEVRAAFTAVTDARETKDTKINEAQKYVNQKMSEAKGEVDAIKSEADWTKNGPY